MKVLDIRTITGPNFYHQRNVIVMTLDLETLTEKVSTDFSGFTDRLISLLPGLKTHQCSLEYSGGFFERLKKGTFFAHIVEHIALELSVGCGIEVNYGKSIYNGAFGRYLIIVRYKSEEGMKYLLHSAVKLTESLLSGAAFDIDTCCKNAKEIININKFSSLTNAIIEEAKKRNIPWQKLNDKNLIQLGVGIFRKLIEATTTSKIDNPSIDIVQDKNLIKKLLEEASIRVPRGRPAYSLPEALEIQEEILVPLAVKPLDGNYQLGISLNVSSQEEMKGAFHLARIYSDIVMIEEYLTGKEYRILMAGGKMVTVSMKSKTNIIDVTDIIHPEIQFMCEKVAKIVGLEICSIDLIAEDITLPMSMQSGGVIEVNASDAFCTAIIDNLKSIKEMKANELIIFFYKELVAAENFLNEMGATMVDEISLFKKNDSGETEKGDEWLQFSY